MAQLCIAPEIGAEKQDNLISGIQDDVPRLGSHLHIASGKTLGQTAHLFKAAVSSGVDCDFLGFDVGGQGCNGFILLPVHGHFPTIDAQSHFVFLQCGFLVRGR